MEINSKHPEKVIEELENDQYTIDDILPSDFEIPDMSPVDVENKEFYRTNKIEFDFSFKGQNYKGELKFERGEGKYMGGVKFTIEGSSDNLVGMFSSRIIKGDPHNVRSEGNGSTNCCFIYHRRVEKEYQRRGFGELGIKMIEKLATDRGNKNKELEINNFEIFTRAISTARLIVDQDWLEENDLVHLKKKNGNNLGYRPHNEQQGLARQVLEYGPLQDTDESYINEYVRFIKGAKKDKKLSK